MEGDSTTKDLNRPLLQLCVQLSDVNGFQQPASQLDGLNVAAVACHANLFNTSAFEIVEGEFWNTLFCAPFQGCDIG